MRLIGYDRPGYGLTPARPDRRVADAAADVAAVADALGLERFAVWGHSGGGPHALAVAALLPERVVAAAALASLAPYDAAGLDWLAGMGGDNLAEFGAALAGREALEAYLREAAPGFLAGEPAELAAAIRSLLSPVDAAVLNGEYALGLIQTIRTGLVARTDGWRDDDLAFVSPWGFDPAAIAVPLLIVHGRQDLFVPQAHGRWLAARVPAAITSFDPNGGHLTVAASAIHKVHEWLLARPGW